MQHGQRLTSTGDQSFKQAAKKVSQNISRRIPLEQSKVSNLTPLQQFFNPLAVLSKTSTQLRQIS